MDPREILHEIVKTDSDARALYDEAVRQKNALGESLREQSEELRREYFTKADERIADFEKREIEKADMKIAEIDKEFNRSIEAYSTFFDVNKEKIALKMFNIIIGQNAGEEDAQIIH